MTDKDEDDDTDDDNDDDDFQSVLLTSLKKKSVWAILNAPINKSHIYR